MQPIEARNPGRGATARNIALTALGVTGTAAAGIFGYNQLFREPAATAPGAPGAPGENGGKIVNPEAPLLERQDFHLVKGAKVTVSNGNLVIPVGAADNRPEGATIPLAGYGLVIKTDGRVSNNLNANPNADPNQDSPEWNRMYDSGTEAANHTGSVAFYVPGADCNVDSFALNTPWEGNLEVVDLRTMAAEYDAASADTRNPGGHAHVLNYDMGRGGMQVGTDLTAAEIFAAREAESTSHFDYELLPGARVVVSGGNIFIPAGAAKGYTVDINVPLADHGLVLKIDARMSNNIDANPANLRQWTKMYDEGPRNGETGSVAYLAPGDKCSTGESFVIYSEWGGNFEIVTADAYKVEFDEAKGHTKNPGGHQRVLEYSIADGGRLMAIS